jgi:hypothetical protein
MFIQNVCDWQRFDVHKDLTPEILSILFAGLNFGTGPMAQNVF